MAKCKNCGNEFEGKRADAKYCSDVCRVIFNRNIKVKPVTDNVTDSKPETVWESEPGAAKKIEKLLQPDYVPPCETTRAFIEQRTGIDSMIKPKPDLRVRRGKDIKCFEDLPPDVQQTIDKMSIVDGKIDQTIKANRTAIAVNYQRLFPGRYYPVSTYRYPQDAAVTGKPGDEDYVKTYADLPEHVKRVAGPMPSGTFARRLPKPDHFSDVSNKVTAL